jgi:hypothetical protein
VEREEDMVAERVGRSRRKMKTTMEVTWIISGTGVGR